MQAPVKKHVSSSRHATGKVTVANVSPLKRSKVMVSDRLWGGVQLIKPMNAPKYGIICGCGINSTPQQSRGCCQ